MSDSIGPITERQLWAAVVKLASLLTMVLVIGAAAVGALLNLGWSLGVDAVLFAVALSLLASGFFSVLKIIDWFAARKTRVSRGDQG